MASGFLGSIGEFDPTSELFSSYLERLEQFFIANDVGKVASDASEAVKKAADPKKVAVMISIIGKKTYNTLRDLCTPSSPKDKTFDELCTILREHYKPRSLEVVGTYKFHQCVQGETESVSEFSARLRRLASDCNFGTYLERSLRDQFITGIRNPNTRKKLLDQDRSFQEALKVAISDEMAQRETALFQRQGSTPTVNTVNKPRGSFRGRGKQVTPVLKQSNQGPKVKSDNPYKCYSCGGTDHLRSKCKHRDKTCHTCQKKGHIAKVCKQKDVHAVEESFPIDDDDMHAIYDVNTVSRHDISVPLKIENSEVTMQLDTGCAFSLAPRQVLFKYAFKPYKCCAIYLHW